MPDQREIGAVKLKRCRRTSQRRPLRRHAGYVCADRTGTPSLTTLQTGRAIRSRLNSGVNSRLVFTIRHLPRSMSVSEVSAKPREDQARPRPLRGALVGRVAPPHDAEHGRARLPAAAARRSRQTERKESRRRRRGRLRRYIPRRGPDPLPQLSAPEIRHLLAGLVVAVAPIRDLLLDWSLWRRRHQATARAAHLRSRHKRQL